MVEYVQKVLSGGRVTIDKNIRLIMGLNVGDHVILRLTTTQSFDGKTNIVQRELKMIPAMVSPRKQKK